MAVAERNSLDTLLDLFRIKADDMVTSTRLSAQKAVASLTGLVRGGSGEYRLLDIRLLEKWIVEMCLDGLTLKTVAHYLDIVAGLYNGAVRENMAPASDMFTLIRARLRTLDLTAWTDHITDADFQRVLSVTRSAYSQKGPIAVATDMMLFALINGCMSIDEVSYVKASDIPGYTSGSELIAQRHIGPRRRYVFDLHQSTRTPRQLERAVADMMLSLFRLRNLPLFGSIQQSLRTFWAYAALSCGFSGSEVVSALGQAPRGLAVLDICTRVELAPHRLVAMRQGVAALLEANPMRWYAMRLRPGVHFDDLRKRFRIMTGEIEEPDMFYPCDEIVRRIGKRLVTERRPVIADVVFFRCRVTDILPIFRRIGDLAWCYTSGGKSDGSYASITDYEFRIFQQAIGQFTPDFEVAPIGALPPREGDRIVMVGGILPGQAGDIARIETDPSQNVIYRIRFGSPNGMKWDFGVDARIARTTSGTTFANA